MSLGNQATPENQIEALAIEGDGIAAQRGQIVRAGLLGQDIEAVAAIPFLLDRSARRPV
jgi:hypothetical protein